MRTRLLRRYPRFNALVASTLFHGVAIALLLVAAVLAPQVTAPDHVITIDLAPVKLHAPRLAPLPNQEGGGGGRQSEQPVREGKPPRAKARIFVPPLLTRSDNPQLVVIPAMMNGPEIDIQSASVGDPLGVRGGGLGIGTGLEGLGDGGGPGNGKGKGGFGEGTAYLGRLSRAPQLLYKEEPEYSEEARKARMQGKVVLLIDVGLDGRATNIRIVQGLGLGLDENAIKAIQRWRFRPALAGDKPVIAPAKVEIGFQLL